jgi:hypothetical protein
MPMESPSPGSHSELCGIITRSQRVFKMRRFRMKTQRNAYGQDWVKSQYLLNKESEQRNSTWVVVPCGDVKKG